MTKLTSRLLRFRFTLALLLFSFVVNAQSTGDFRFDQKAASGAFNPRWWPSPSTGNIPYYNGPGLLSAPSTAYGRGAFNLANAAAFRLYIGAGTGSGTVTNVTATAPLASSGGATPNVTHNASGVVAGSYTSANITIDATGHITTAANGAGGGVTNVTATFPLTSTGGATPDIAATTSTGGNGVVDAGKVLVFNSEGEIAASSTAGQNAVSGIVASGPGAGVYAENNGTGNAVVGIAVGGGIGGVFLATGAEGVTATSDTQPGGSFTNSSTTEPALHVQNNDATNAGDLFHFHNDANQGVEGGNDGTLSWTTATGAQGTATNLPVFGALTKGVVPAAGAVPAATNFLTETGTFAVPAGTGIQDGDVLTLGLTFPNQGLEILDTGGGQALTIVANENLSADRKLNIIINDATKTLTVAADATISNTNSGDVTIGTANGLSLAGQALSLGLSSTSTTGALSDTDWDTFNNKQAALTLGTGVTTALSNNADSPSGFVTQTGGDARYQLESKEEIIVLDADFANNSATYTNVLDGSANALAITLDANSTYYLEGRVVSSTPSASTGVGYALTMTGSPTTRNVVREYLVAQTQTNALSQSLNADDTYTTVTSYTANTKLPTMLNGLVVTSGSTCTITLRVIRGGTSNTVTTYAGSFLKATKLP